MILDDHEDHVESLSLLFCAWGFSVRNAKGGPAALDGIKRVQTDVLIVDIGKRHLGGLDIVHRIRTTENLKRILVIALSGFAQPGASGHALDAGCDFFFAKPADPRILQDLIKSL